MKRILTGPLGCGKTTEFQRLLKLYDDSPKRILTTEPVKRNGRTVGYALTADGKESRMFANELWKAEPVFDRYGIRPKVFSNFGVDFFRSVRPGEMLCIDELGIMEQSAADYVDAVSEALCAAEDFLVVIQERMLGFWTEKLPSAEVTFIKKEDLMTGISV